MRWVSKSFGATALAAILLTIIAAPARATTNDPLADQQWGLTAIGAQQVWGISTGVGVLVAVLDSGTGPHPDLDANLNPGTAISNLNEAPGAADVSVASHGTHVAGIIAAIANNSIGVVGVAPGARILPIRILDSRGLGDGGDVARGVRIAVDAGAKVINLSLGGKSESKALTDAIQYAVDRDVLVVAAAGNDGEAAAPSWPASGDTTIAVTAVDRNNVAATFDQRGEYIDITAPGVSIFSTKTSGFTCDGVAVSDGYGCISGSSMAAAFVSGSAALLFSAHPGVTAAQVRTILLTTATDIGALGRDTTFGVGLVNLPAAFAALAAMFPAILEVLIDTSGRVNSLASRATQASILAPQYQWYRCSETGASQATLPPECSAIPGATAATYQITAKDLRMFLRLGLTAANLTSFSSASTKVVGVWLNDDAFVAGESYPLAAVISSPSKGTRSIKVIAGECSVRGTTLRIKNVATGCTIRVDISAKAPFPALGFTMKLKVAS